MVSNSGNGSNRSKLSKAGLIALAFVAALILGAVFINSGLSRDAVYQRQADANTREYTAYTDQQIRQSCVRLIGDKKANCVAKYRHESRDNERNEQDLVAQRKSANWAYIMGAAAVIGMVLSVIGVVLVWTTFDETRKANILSKVQQRARIVLDFQSGFGNETGNLVVVIKGRNIGHSTATNCQISVNDGFDVPQDYVAESEIFARHTITGQPSVSLATYSRVDQRADGYYLYGVVTYDCIFGDAHKTYFCVSILPSRKVPDHTTSNLINAVACKPANWPADT